MKKDWTSGSFVHHWKYYRPPARPTRSDLAFIRRKILSKGGDARVLILGATPEYRELCGRLGFPVTILDFNRKNVLYLRREVIHRPKETIVERNWLSEPLRDRFDIILGDNVANVIRKEDVPRLLRNLAEMLADDGFLLVRTYIRHPGERITQRQIIALRRQFKPYGLFSSTARAIMLCAYRFREDGCTMDDWWGVVEGMRRMGFLTARELEFYRRCSWEGSDFHFHMPLRKAFERRLRQHFKILEVFQSPEPFLRGVVPLYVLQRRKDSVSLPRPQPVRRR